MIMGTDNVLIIGGDGIETDYPAVQQTIDAVTDAGYETETIELSPGFEDRETGLDDIYDAISETLESDTWHLVGYSAGATLAVHYRSHPNVASVTANDPPTGLAADTVHEINTVIDDPALTAVYPEEAAEAYRLDGDHTRVEIADVAHDFWGRESELAETVVAVLDYHARDGRSIPTALDDVRAVSCY
jgi:pimeloyl-ACP methyl ester carboxylesterase